MKGRTAQAAPADQQFGYPARLTSTVTVVLLAGLTAVGIVVRLHRDSTWVAVLGAVLSLGAGVPVLLRTRLAPVLVVGLAATAAAGAAVLDAGVSSSLGWFAVALLAGACAFVHGPRVAVPFWLGTVVLFAAEWIWVEPDPGWAAWMAGTTISAAAMLLVRHQIELVVQLRAAQAGLAEQARTQERNRIARELHDVIAHTLTVSLLHVSGARLAVEYDPKSAAEALAEAERLGRECLAEVRSAVGMLRPDSPGDGTAPPLPGVDALPELVERFRRAGTDVRLEHVGDLARLQATTGLALYRILQESLTNAAKHATGAPVIVRLAVDADAVRLTVDSAGPPGRGSGLGTVGMRERAESLGGSCVIGPGGRGWLVTAILPLGAPQRVAQ